MKRFLHKRKLLLSLFMIVAFWFFVSEAFSQKTITSANFNSGYRPSGWVSDTSTYSTYMTTWRFNYQQGPALYYNTPADPYEGKYCAGIDNTAYYYSTVLNGEYLLRTKAIDLSEYVKVKLDFWWSGSNYGSIYGYGQNDFTVYYRSSSKWGPNSGWTAAKTWTNIDETGWAHAEVDVPDDSLTDDFQFAFGADLKCNYFYYDNGVLIDDVKIKGIPTSGFDIVMTSVDSPITWAPDAINKLTVSIGNWGADSLGSLKFNYVLDGGTTVSEAYTFSPDSFGAGDVLQYTFSSQPYISSGSHKIKFWIDNLNTTGGTDDDASNDTIELKFNTALKDTLIIDVNAYSGYDYKSITAAINDLVKYGAAGPVVFMIRGGTYNESLDLEPYVGASYINSVVFDGVHRDSVLITDDQITTFLLNGADYVTIKNMTIENTQTSSSYAHGIALIGHADYNVIENVHVKMSGTYSYHVGILAADYEYVYSYGRNDYNLIKDCEIDGGNYGIRFNGVSDTDPGVHNTVVNCDVNAYYYGLYFYYQRYYRNDHNTLRVSGGYYPHYIAYSGDGNTHYNDILGQYGLRQYYENYYFGDSTMVTNNMVQGDFYCYRMDKGRVYHNSFRSMYYGFYWYYFGASNKMHNNIFDLSGGNYTFYAYYWYGSQEDITHNIFYDPSPYAYCPGGYQSGWTDIWNAYGMPNFFDYNWSDQPNFVSSSDLHLTTSVQPKYGLLGFGIEDDFDGDTRCLWGPTVGADESNYPVPAPTANFASEDTICYNIETVFQNVADKMDAKGHFWYLNGDFETNDLHYSNTFKQRGYDTIKLVTYSCGGVDSVEKVVYVDTPTMKTNPEFLSDVNLIEASQTVTFTDLSSNCPNAWEWRILPDSSYDASIGIEMPSVIYDNSTANSKNPSMIFMYPGTYDVCLYVNNGLGYDTICKEDYIIVKASHNICDYAGVEVTQSGFGLLFDDGGKDGDYANNNSPGCELLLEPCAKEMSLTFEEFDVANGDYLEVYDDKGGNALWDVSIYPDGLTGATNVTALGKDSIITSPTGRLYIVWTTNGSTVASGFKAEWSSVADTFADPTAMFDVQDTACVGENVYFEGMSTGQNLIYEWDMDNDGFIDQFIEDPEYIYLFGGTYPVKFSVSSTCNPNTATYTKDIVVIQPNQAPIPDFITENRKPVVNKSAVSFEDLTQGCVDSWTWIITPSTFTGVSGYPNGQMPVVTFNDTGCYDVTLVSSYMGYNDTITKKCYIQPMIYCDPAVVNTNADIGISRVKIGTIDNRTSIGEDKYTSYLSSHSTNLELSARYPITIERNTAINAATRKVWIDWNVDGDFNDSLELVINEKNAHTTVYNDTIEVPAFAISGTAVMRVSVSLGTIKSEPCGPVLYGEIEDYEVVISPDQTPPVITLKGMDTINLNQCDGYVDAGATARDNIDGNVTAGIVVTNNLDVTVPGNYAYRYNVMDVAGNEATEVVRLIIVKPDTIGPNVTLKGNMIDSVPVFTGWADAGYNVSMRCEAVVGTGVDASALDTSVVGEYKIIYTATDAIGNVTEVIRYVRVVDMIDPVISLYGNAVDSVEVFNSYVDPGVGITDNYYSGLTATVTGSVNTNVVGDYVLEYSVTDGSGNGPVTITRTVKVVDTEVPEIFSFIYDDEDEVEVEVNTVFKAPKFVLSDNYYETFTESETGTYFANFPTGEATALGNYTYVYNVEDGSGNKAVFTLYIEVVDNEAPVIALEGNNYVELCRYDVLTESATVTDNFDQSVQIVEGGSYVSKYLVNMEAGLYTVTYSAVDVAGNAAIEVSRAVKVFEISSIPGEACYSGVEDNVLTNAVSVFPNPGKGQLNVSVSLDRARDISLVITNTLGQVVYETVAYNVSTEVISLDLNLSNGLYNIRVQTDDGSALFPIVIAK